MYLLEHYVCENTVSGDLLDNFDKKLSLDTQLEYGLIFEDSMPQAQMVDIIYA